MSTNSNQINIYFFYYFFFFLILNTQLFILENLNFGSQQIPPMRREDQLYSSNMPYSSMEENPNMYPIPQQPMMQGFQSPFPFNPINQQQLSLLLMSTYARMITLMQLMSTQNRYQPYNQFYGIF